MEPRLMRMESNVLETRPAMPERLAEYQGFPPEHFLNRELSLLEFQRRVLAQAADPRVPLLERLKFLCIVSNNLDEFFEIRVAGLKGQIELGGLAGADGLTPLQVFQRVSAVVRGIVAEQYRLFND